MSSPIAAAKPHADAGQAALTAGDYTTANAEFDRAIAAIGDAHEDPATLDDTGMQLVLADAKLRQGDAKGAATLKASVVRTRLAQAAAAR